MSSEYYCTCKSGRANTLANVIYPKWSQLSIQNGDDKKTEVVVAGSWAGASWPKVSIHCGRINTVFYYKS